MNSQDFGFSRFGSLFLKGVAIVDAATGKGSPDTDVGIEEGIHRRALRDETAVGYAARLTPEDQDTLTRLMDLSFRLLRDSDDAGVKMIAGTDYGGGWVVPSVSLHHEFDLLEKCGLSPLKVLQRRSINASQILRLEKTSGSVETGRNANLVLLEANPVDSIMDLHIIPGLVRNGRHDSTDDLASLMLKVEQKLASGAAASSQA